MRFQGSLIIYHLSTLFPRENPLSTHGLYAPERNLEGKMGNQVYNVWRGVLHRQVIATIFLYSPAPFKLSTIFSSLREKKHKINPPLLP